MLGPPRRRRRRRRLVSRSVYSSFGRCLFIRILHLYSSLDNHHRAFVVVLTVGFFGATGASLYSIHRCFSRLLLEEKEVFWLSTNAGPSLQTERCRSQRQEFSGSTSSQVSNYLHKYTIVSSSIIIL